MPPCESILLPEEAGDGLFELHLVESPEVHNSRRKLYAEKYSILGNSPLFVFLETNIKNCQNVKCPAGLVPISVMIHK